MVRSSILSTDLASPALHRLHHLVLLSLANISVMIEIPDAVVLRLANTLTPFIATRSGQRLYDVRMNEDLWWR